MSKGATKSGTVIGFPRAVTDAVKDETVASIVDVLQEQLRFAREGKLRSVAVVQPRRCSKPDRQADCAGSRHHGRAPVSSVPPSHNSWPALEAAQGKICD